MLDINYIRQNTDKVKQVLKDRNFDIDLNQLLELDEKRRGLIVQVDLLRQQRNEAAKSRDIESGKKIKEQLDSLEQELKGKESEYLNILLKLPNIPLDNVPIGKD